MYHEPEKFMLKVVKLDSSRLPVPSKGDFGGYKYESEESSLVFRGFIYLSTQQGTFRRFG